MRFSLNGKIEFQAEHGGASSEIATEFLFVNINIWHSLACQRELTGKHKRADQ